MVGADVPVSRGQNNFDAVRYEFFRDRDFRVPGFTAKNYLFREELTSRVWATRYDFRRSATGRVKRDITRCAARSGCKAGSSIPQGDIQGQAGARGHQLRVRFRMDQQDHHVRGLSKDQSLFENSDMMAVASRGRTNWPCWKPFRGRSRRGVR